MDSKPIVILNCRSRETLRPDLLSSLRKQNHAFELQILESDTCPNRLNQIIDENKLYFFFDEDIELPSSDYLKNNFEIFKKNPALLVIGGKYLLHNKQTYLAKSYNSQIEFWLFKENNPTDINICQNLPGGAWIISGKLKKYLSDWQEPLYWAGEDTFSIRWLQTKGIKIFHHHFADVFHFPQSHFYHFCRRAYLQGHARARSKLKSDYNKINWSLLWKYRIYWPGWILHQFFVELGSVSFTAKKRPTTSPVA